MNDCRQMTIFDFLKPETDGTDIENMTSAEIAKIIGDAIGIAFDSPDWEEGYFKAKYKKITFSIGKSRLSCDCVKRKAGDAFIAVGVDGKLWGCGCPAETIDEAISFFKRYMEKEDAL